MVLIWLAIGLFIAFVTIPFLWKIAKFVLLLTLLPLRLPYAWLFESPYKGEPSPYSADNTAIWVQGKNGECFRYDLSLSGSELDTQMENLDAFYKRKERQESERTSQQP